MRCIGWVEQAQRWVHDRGCKTQAAQIPRVQGHPCPPHRSGPRASSSRCPPRPRAPLPCAGKPADKARVGDAPPPRRSCMPCPPLKAAAQRQCRDRTQNAPRCVSLPSQALRPPTTSHKRQRRQAAPAKRNVALGPQVGQPRVPGQVVGQVERAARGVRVRRQAPAWGGSGGGAAHWLVAGLAGLARQEQCSTQRQPGAIPGGWEAHCKGGEVCTAGRLDLLKAEQF